MSAAEYAVGVALEPVATFADFVEIHGRALGGFALLVTGNRADAQDALQDALIGAYPRWAQIVGRGDPVAYVRRSIVNRHISMRRKLWRLVALDDNQRAVADPTVELIKATARSFGSGPVELWWENGGEFPVWAGLVQHAKGKACYQRNLNYGGAEDVYLGSADNGANPTKKELREAVAILASASRLH